MHSGDVWFESLSCYERYCPGLIYIRYFKHMDEVSVVVTSYAFILEMLGSNLCCVISLFSRNHTYFKL